MMSGVNNTDIINKLFDLMRFIRRCIDNGTGSNSETCDWWSATKSMHNSKLISEGEFLEALN